MEPTYPQGTPEHEAYAAELRTELGKFARGEEPYPYSPSWDSIDATPEQYDALPVDLTPDGIDGRPACWRVEAGIRADRRPTGGVRGSWLCTRPVGHTGRHAAGDGLRIRAVW